MAKIDTTVEHPEPGRYDNILVYWLKGQLVARTIGRFKRKLRPLF